MRPEGPDIRGLDERLRLLGLLPRPCPVCGEELDQVQGTRFELSGELGLEPVRIPLGAIICGNCLYVELHTLDVSSLG